MGGAKNIHALSNLNPMLGLMVWVEEEKYASNYLLGFVL